MGAFVYVLMNEDWMVTHNALLCAVQADRSILCDGPGPYALLSFRGHVFFLQPLSLKVQRVCI